MKDQFQRPHGEIDGSDLPMRGSRTGFVSRDTAMGMSVDRDATNSMGSIKSDTKSDAWDECCAMDPLK